MTIKISNEEREMISYSDIRLIAVFEVLKQVMTDPKPYYCTALLTNLKNIAEHPLYRIG
jgi:hypothetical protein